MERNWSDLDPDEFTHFLDGGNLTEDEKRECVEYLWLILTEFVSLAFGEHPVQHAQKARERDHRQDTDKTRQMVADYFESERKKLGSVPPPEGT